MAKDKVRSVLLSRVPFMAAFPFSLLTSFITKTVYVYLRLTYEFEKNIVEVKSSSKRMKEIREEVGKGLLKKENLSEEEKEKLEKEFKENFRKMTRARG